MKLDNYVNLKSEFFLERRELGVINVGKAAKISVDGKSFELNKYDCLYVGMGAKDLEFAGDGATLFLLSAPAHHAYDTRLMKAEEASPVSLGAKATANERTIYKYIHLEGIQSCQLVMGLTILKEGSVVEYHAFACA